MTEPEVAQIVSRFPGESLSWGLYQVLGQWAAGELDSAAVGAHAAVPAVATSIGNALAALGDDSLRAAVQAISTSTGEQRQSLAKGHRALSRGVELFELQEVSTASGFLSRSYKDLHEGGSPAAQWARYWYGATSLSSADFVQIDRRLLPLLDQERRKRTSPLLLGSVARTSGSAALRQEKYSTALDLYSEALAAFESVGDLEAAGEVRNYLADVHGFLAQPELEWDHRFVSIALLAEGSPSWFSTTLSRAARSLVESGEPALARPFAEESLDTLLRHREPAFVDLVEAHTVLSRVEWLAGHREAAQHHFDEAESALARIGDQDFSERLRADLLLYRGEYLSKADPHIAVAELEAAARAYFRTGARFYEARALLLRAKSWRALGNLSEAMNDLERGIRAHERALAAVGDPLKAVAFAEVWQGLFDEMASLQLGRDGNARAAMSYLDRAKDTTLRARIGSARSTSRSNDLNRADVLQAARELLSPEELLVSMAVIDDGRIMLGWASREQGWTFRLQDGENAAHAIASALLVDFREGRLSAEDPRLSELGRRLLSPLEMGLAEPSRLLIVPDRWLNQVPFAALRAREGGRALVEERELVVVPSLAHFVRSRRGRLAAGRSGEAPSALLVAVIAPSVGVPSLGLAPLSATGAEARAIQALYPGSFIAVGPEASKAALLNALAHARVVHFAGHAVAEPGNPLAARLWTSDETNRKLAQEVRGLELAAAGIGPALQLVVLSACQTALPSDRRFVGNDGLAAIFLARGVPAVLATLWSVDDRLASQFTVSFHHRWSTGLDAATALAQTQREFLNSTEEAARRPSVWAAFQLTGEAVKR